MSTKLTGVTEQQDKFARYYVKYGKGSIAYRKAYTVGKDTKPERVWEGASRLIADPKVAARIEHYRKLADQHWSASVEKIATQLGMMAFVDKREIYDENGALKDPRDWPEHIARTVQGVEVFEEKNADGETVGYTRKVKFESRAAALQMLAKWKGMAIDRSEIGAPGDFDHLSDEEVSKELAAERAALAVIERAQAKKKKPAKA